MKSLFTITMLAAVFAAVLVFWASPPAIAGSTVTFFDKGANLNAGLTVVPSEGGMLGDQSSTFTVGVDNHDAMVTSDLIGNQLLTSGRDAGANIRSSASGNFLDNSTHPMIRATNGKGAGAHGHNRLFM